ncbi:flavin reductase family protein [Catenuloplanes indicus]|uniref:Flavin reductase (DIM6/NTAB) family NADH-FMN oxidoreductase RutF n=1 Tax=Catenuloplanes indicus TaxID=137267 RepID=A0AAE3VW91_9ACTN|nr:flavin reductase family protein [Catenuloplanes indicus]MDQ0364402.1 flavin reductase (DIM6/NTAB) family NADH-FMN oxidoreductase RutF [Catenuloplanes indicus]
MTSIDQSTDDSRRLRKVYGAFATGVTVVTVGGPVPHAMTANSFTTVSLDPPLVLVCVEHQAVMHDSLRTAGHFGVSVLGASQAGVARWFADRSRPLGREQFDDVDWHPGRCTAAPLISGAIAYVECEVWRAYDGGDHTIFLGRVLSAEHGVPGEEALLFHGGRFRLVEKARSEVTV